MLFNSEPDTLIPYMRYLLMEIPYARFISRIHSASFFTVVLIQTYEFSQHFDVQICMQYGVFHLACMVLLNVNLMYPPFIDSFIQAEESYKDLFLMDVKAFNTRSAAISRREVKRIMLLFVTVAFLNVITVGSFNISWIRNSEEQMLIVKFLKRFTSLDSAIAQMVLWIIHIFNMSSILPLAAIPSYFFYLVLHLRLKLLLLIDYINNFNDFLIREEKPNKTFIKMNMKLIVERHLQLKWYTTRISASNELMFTVYLLMGGVVSFICVYMIFSPIGSVINGLMMLFTHGVVLCALCNLVQRFVDDKQHFVNSIYNIRWYNWDIESQYMFLILLTNASEGFQVFIFQLIQVDHDLVKRMYHLVYTLASCFYSLRRSHS